MKKDIQKPFFEAFEFGGVVHNCIDVIKDRYDLGYLPKPTQEEDNKRIEALSPEKREEFIQIQEYWDNFYGNVAPERIRKGYDEFDYTIIEDYDYSDDASIEVKESSLMEEIEENLKECSTQKEQEKYIFSLLKPFKEFSDVFYPLEVINHMNIELKNMEDKAVPDSTIDKYKEQIERVYYISQRFHEISGLVNNEHGEYSIDPYLWEAVYVERLFANRLDALLLEHGIDLMRLQEECGIYLKLHRRVEDVEPYIGSMKLAQKYIDDLGTHKENKQIKENSIESKRDTAGNNISFDEVIIKKAYSKCNGIHWESVDEKDFTDQIATGNMSLKLIKHHTKTQVLFNNLKGLLDKNDEWANNVEKSLSYERLNKKGLRLEAESSNPAKEFNAFLDELKKLKET